MIKRIKYYLKRKVKIIINILTKFWKPIIITCLIFFIYLNIRTVCPIGDPVYSGLNQNNIVTIRQDEEQKKSDDIFQIVQLVVNIVLSVTGIVSTFFITIISNKKKYEYIDNIVGRLSRTKEKLEIITTILQNDESYKILLNKIENSQLKNFDRNEIKNIFGCNTEKESIILFQNVKQTINSDEMKIQYKEYLDEIYDIEKQKELFPLSIKKLINETLDEFDLLCKNINNQKNTEYIYNQYHTDILEYIYVLSIIISEYNKIEVDKKYTEIIRLFNKWTKKRQEDIEMELYLK